MKAESPLRPAVRAVADGGETASVRIDLVRFTGDVLSALFLGQVLYWFGTSRDGYCRAQVTISGEDGLWLAKADDQWFDETGLTAAQARRIRQALEREGWLRVLTKRFNGTPTTHIQPTERLQADLEAWHSSPPVERAKRDRITLPPASTCQLAESAPAPPDSSGCEVGLAKLARPTCQVDAPITIDLQETYNALKDIRAAASDDASLPEDPQRPEAANKEQAEPAPKRARPAAPVAETEPRDVTYDAPRRPTWTLRLEAPTEAEQTFELWKHLWMTVWCPSSPGVSFTSHRQKAAAKALKEHGFDRCVTALLGATLDTWDERARFADLDVLLRGANVDRFVADWTARHNGPRHQPGAPAEPPDFGEMFDYQVWEVLERAIDARQPERGVFFAAWAELRERMESADPSRLFALRKTVEGRKWSQGSLGLDASTDLVARCTARLGSTGTGERRFGGGFSCTTGDQPEIGRQGRFELLAGGGE